MLDPEIIKYRNYIMAHFKSIDTPNNQNENEENNKNENEAETKPQQPIVPVEYPTHSESLTMVIKAYDDPLALSHRLKVAPIGSKYNIQGPIGAGLEIKESFSGECVIIAAGTGILPFIDLLDMLYKKILQAVCKIKNLDSNFIKPEQDYSKFFPGAKFKLLCAFRTLDDFIGYEWIGHMAKLSAEHNLNIFSCICRIKTDQELSGIKKTRDYFNKDFFKKTMGLNADKIFVCGPPLMHVSIQNDLVGGQMTIKGAIKGLGYKQDRVFYV